MWSAPGPAPSTPPTAPGCWRPGRAATSGARCRRPCAANRPPPRTRAPVFSCSSASVASSPARRSVIRCDADHNRPARPCPASPAARLAPHRRPSPCPHVTGAQAPGPPARAGPCSGPASPPLRALQRSMKSFRSTASPGPTQLCRLNRAVQGGRRSAWLSQREDFCLRTGRSCRTSTTESSEAWQKASAGRCDAGDLAGVDARQGQRPRGPEQGLDEQHRRSWRAASVLPLFGASLRTPLRKSICSERAQSRCATCPGR